MGAVHGKRVVRPEPIFATSRSLEDDDDQIVVRLPKVRDPGDGAENPPEMSASNLKLRGDDIDSYLDDALDELDDGSGSGSTPQQIRRAPPPPPPPRRTMSRDSVRSGQSTGSSRPGSGVLTGGGGTPSRRYAGPSEESDRSQHRDYRALSNEKGKSLSKKEAKRAAVAYAQQSRGFHAVTTGDLNTLQHLLLDSSTELSATTRDSRGSTLLHKAAECGQVHCLQWLVLRCTPDAVHVQDADFATPAMQAIVGDHIDCVKVLVEANGGEIERSDRGISLLHHAAYYGKEECLGYLLDKWRERQNQLEELGDDHGTTPAHLAAKQGHLPCLQAMVEAQLDVTQEDVDGQTPIDWANSAGQKACAHYLLLVDSCHTLTMTVSKLQSQLMRSRDESQSLKSQLSEECRSRQLIEEELREEFEENVEEVRKEYVDMTVKLMEKLDKKTQSDEAAVEVAEKLAISEKRADRAEAEARQLAAKLEEAYEKINRLTDVIDNKLPTAAAGSRYGGAHNVLPISRMAEEVLQEQRARIRTSKSCSPIPPPRIESWERVYEVKRSLRGQSWSTGASSNTLHSSGSSLEI
eukprot:m.69802 g.69802  ORF g.69802 m.69802 type:complete len:579 (+) comp35631_c0_seq4:129-1865(+)